MSFQDILNNLKQSAGELKVEALKYRHKDFMRACMSGSALIALADGAVSAEEKQKMLRFIENFDALSVFSSKEMLECFQNYATLLELDKDLGEAKTYDAIRKMSADDQPSRLVLRLIIAIAGADGNFDDQEKYVAKKIAQELKIDPAEFELA
ncbi:MAG: Tellurite resistance TerB [Methylococcaceae bacterium]|nr:MAG: Tellurite resistance TerB [Methylococcaceae bacterium]